MQTRQYSDGARVLTLHQGGAERDELRVAITEARDALAELALALPAADRLRRPVTTLAQALTLRLGRI